VRDELLERLKVTVPLALFSVFLSYLLALPLGIFAAVRQGSPLEVGSTTLLFVLYAVPVFWGGMMLQLVFGAVGFDILPVLGLHDPNAESFTKSEAFWDTVRHGILPVVTLSYAGLAYLSRQMRVGVVDSITQDYVRTARAKGLSEKSVIGKHVLRNSMIPIITVFASILPILIGGSIVVESVFDIPGMGLYAYEGLQNREYNVIMACTLAVAVMTMLGILLSDILYALVDPRIRYD
jgi:peptide/nickel transport system permease protein